MSVAVTHPIHHQHFISPWGQLVCVPSRGGIVTSWICDGKERLYFDENRFEKLGQSVRGGIPILFPICGNLPGDRLQLPQGSFLIPQHGFARDSAWKYQVLDSGDGIRLVLDSTPETKVMFPFSFRLSLEYRLQPSSLDILATVEHSCDGECPMPFSLGLHPYFAVSALHACSIDGMPEMCLDHHRMASSSTSKQLANLSEGVDFLSNPARDAVRLVDESSGQTITIELTAPLDLAVVWTEPPRSMICLEPWTAPRGSLATGDRCLELEPGEAMQLRCRFVCSDPG